MAVSKLVKRKWQIFNLIFKLYKMAIIDVRDTWKYVALKSLLGIYVCVLTFNLLSNWHSKERESLRILIYGTGGFGLLVAALISENFHSFLLISKIIIVLTSTGILATRERLKTNKPPAELFLNTYGAIFIIVLGLIWWIFFTEYENLEKSEKKNSHVTKERNMRTMERSRFLEKDTDNSTMDSPEYTRFDKKVLSSRPFNTKRRMANIDIDELADLIF